MFYKTDVLKSFTKIAGKLLPRILLFNKVAVVISYVNINKSGYEAASLSDISRLITIFKLID